MPSDAKASAYSSIFTFFPALLVLGAVLATLNRGEFTCASLLCSGHDLPAAFHLLAYLRAVPISRWSARHHVIVDDLERLRRDHLLDDGFAAPTSFPRPGA